MLLRQLLPQSENQFDAVKAAVQSQMFASPRHGNSHKEGEGNLVQLIDLQSEDVPGLKQWLEKHQYMSDQVVNEIITLMGNTVLSKLPANMANICEACWYSWYLRKCPKTGCNQNLRRCKVLMKMCEKLIIIIGKCHS